jgi:DNA modification methylase
MPRRPLGATQQIQALAGDARHLERVASHFPPKGLDVILTSPPYWQRRDYQHVDQLGQEPTPEAFVETLADTVASWAQWLAPHGSIFINLADTHRNGFLVGTPVLFEVACANVTGRCPIV